MFTELFCLKGVKKIYGGWDEKSSFIFQFQSKHYSIFCHKNNNRTSDGNNMCFLIFTITLVSSLL
jgi:hypothetical protein